jgi:predicted nucleotide-binding protein
VRSERRLFGLTLLCFCSKAELPIRKAHQGYRWASAHVTATHDKINVFIISSVEALEIARTIQNALAHNFTNVLWTDGVFRASWYPIESLERQLDQSDFAVAVVQPDDMTSIRGTEVATPRDNVISYSTDAFSDESPQRVDLLHSVCIAP